MFLTDAQPEFPADFHNEFGYMPDYKGLGIFLYRSESRGKWYVMSIQNNGLESITMTRNLDKHINAKNSCEFELNQGERGGIRIKVLMDYIYLFKRDANGDPSYSKCSVNQIRDPYFNNFFMVSNNQHREDRISSIDVEAIYFKNYDSAVYQDKADLATEKLELTAQLKNIQKLEDGTFHPQDLMAHKIQMHMEEENRRALTILDEKDDRLEILYKHYETIISFQHAFSQLIKKADDYRQQEEFEGHWTLKASQLMQI